VQSKYEGQKRTKDDVKETKKTKKNKNKKKNKKKRTSTKKRDREREKTKRMHYQNANMMMSTRYGSFHIQMCITTA
jgi:hypothetical protein